MGEKSLLKKRWSGNSFNAIDGGRVRLSLLIICALAFALLLASCGSKDKTASKDFDAADEDDATQNASVKRNVKPQADAEAAVIETDYGKIVIELYPNLAPNMVARFKQLIKEGFYNGTTFHRVDPGLGIIQGGDPLSKDGNPDNDGQGNSQYPNVAAEFSDVPFERGIVGAARAKSFDSANCQFFITLMRQPAFETEGNRYTVFGRVIDNQRLNNAGVILGAPVTSGTQQPSDKIVIKNITLQPRANFGS
jgi:cyclophilin family peptidyl-prolyl cis-trans isomerase